MPNGFSAFSSDAIDFFRELEQNNNREWFQAHKPTFEEKVKAPMIDLVAALNAELIKFGPAYVNDPAKAIYRIYRDTRFSSDKTPYKTHIAAIFPRRGLEKHACAGLYFSVSHKEIEVAGGVYMPAAEQLLAIRGHLAERHEEFRAIIGDKSLRRLMGELQGDKLSRAPKGFPPDHPAADLLRHKQWLYFVTLEPALATTLKLLPELVKRLRALTPVVDFLNIPLLGRKRERSAYV